MRHTVAHFTPGSVQRGVALITAILVVAIATIIATSIYFDGFLYIKRSGNLLLNDQARMYALGAEDWAADILRRDARESAERDHLGEEWAAELPILPIDGGTLQGRLEDLQGRFNLNNLVDLNGQTDDRALEQFQRLLEALGLPPQLAGFTADWLDADQEPRFPDGAEDMAYSAKRVPYRAANGPITTASELLAVEGFGRASFDTLAPYVIALPSGTLVNVNTASAPVLFAIVPELSASDAEGLIENRPDDGFANMEEFLSLAETADPLELSLRSDYFRVFVRVSVGTHQQSMYSLLARDVESVRVVLRNFGSE